MTSAPKRCWMDSGVSCGVLWLKNKEVFFLLSCWPEAHSYVSKICSRRLHSSFVAWQKIILSSAKRRCDMQGPYGQAATPCRSPLLVAWRRRDYNPFAQNKKRKGDIGSPCLKPLVGVIWPLGFPLILIEYVTEVTQSIIVFTHLAENPIFSMISFKHPHSTLSKALLISSFRAISPYCPRRLLFK